MHGLENNFYQAPYAGKINATELEMIVRFGEHGLVRAKEKMITPGRYNSRVLGSHRFATHEYELNPIFFTLSEQLNQISQDSSLSIGGIVATLPRDIKLKWFDFEGAVMSVFEQDYLEKKGNLGASRFVGQPEIITDLVRHPDASSSYITPLGIRYLEDGTIHNLSLPHALAVDPAANPIVTHAYNLEFTALKYNWREARGGRAWFDSPTGVSVLSQSLSKICPYTGEENLSLPKGKELNYVLVVAQNPTAKSLTPELIRSQAIEHGYDDAIHMPFENPTRIAWFILNIAAGRLRRERNWAKYFNPVAIQQALP